MELTLRSSIPGSSSTHRRIRTLPQSALVPSSHINSSIFPSSRTRINPQLVSTKPLFAPRAAAQMGDNGSSSTSTASQLDSVGARRGEVKRVTKETNVFVRINLDGTGVSDSSSGIPFLDHMLDQLASHGLFDVHVRATGDVHIDDHHTNEDVALAIGTALLQALGDRKGIHRFGDFSAPLDEALIHVALDLSGRPHLGYDLQIPTERVGTYDTQLVEHFFQSLVNTSGMTLHIRQLAGKNSHHIIEATFKAFARALRQATEADPRRLGTVPRFLKGCSITFLICEVNS
ncbi:Imidazoleglycerol-phosphate dehydratase 2, chloroplastic [Linum perenne]